MNIILIVSLFLLTACVSSTTNKSDERNTASVESLQNNTEELKNLVSKNCAECHSGSGEKVRNFGDFIKSDALRKYVDFNNPKNSVLYKQIASGEMPDAKQGYILDDATTKKMLSSIEKWVKEGAPALSPAKIQITEPVQKMTLEKTQDLIIEDLKKIDPSYRIFYRYFDFSHIYNNPKKRADLPSYYKALTKLINSLSWNKEFIYPQAVNAEKTLYRVSFLDLNLVSLDEIVKQYYDKTELSPEVRLARYRAANEEAVNKFFRIISLKHGNELGLFSQFSNLLWALRFQLETKPRGKYDQGPGPELLRLANPNARVQRQLLEIIDLYNANCKDCSTDNSYSKKKLFGNENPFLFPVDWFVSKVVSTNAYHRMLNRDNLGEPPTTLRNLYRYGLNSINFFKRDKKNNLLGTDLFAGFQDSGISFSNRVLQRFDTNYGYFWRSFDFVYTDDKNENDRWNHSKFNNIFHRPIHYEFGRVETESFFEREPDVELQNSDRQFKHDGSETIYSLPNGLQGYGLYDRADESVTVAGSNIVSDPQMPDRLIRNSVSCFRCHSGGIISKKDQVLDFTKTDFAKTFFNSAELKFISKKYRPNEIYKKMEEDKSKYQAAVAKLLGEVDKGNEFINSVYKNYNAVVDEETFRSEFDLNVLGSTELSPLAKVDLNLAKAGRLTRGQFLTNYFSYFGVERPR